MVKSSKAIYSSKILKAGSILTETKILLADWDNSVSVNQDLDRFRQNNILGKASRSRVEDILKVFKQRYLVEEHVTKALVSLVKARCPADSLNQILYFHAARSDPLIHDFVIEVLWPRYQKGRQDIIVRDAEDWIREKISKGVMTSPWSKNTIMRSAGGLMSTLRDFGILQGLNNKSLIPAYLPVDAFSYIAFYLSKLQPSGKRLLESKEWQLFFLGTDAVERLFMEAHQQHFLDYNAAGSVIRIVFPSESIEEYVHVILERAH
ncbi:MAG: DUF1819 family protein [Methanotrichaceae archaeon]|nr:DUF1819 family protein [Methanotrichaceae archaeon]